MINLLLSFLLSSPRVFFFFWRVFQAGEWVREKLAENFHGLINTCELSVLAAPHVYLAGFGCRFQWQLTVAFAIGRKRFAGENAEQVSAMMRDL